MVTYYVKKNEIYKVTATVNCAVYDASGSPIITADGGETVSFKAQTTKISLSDNNAVLKKAVNESSGTVIADEVNAHMDNAIIHLNNSQVSRIANAAQTNDSNSFSANQIFKASVSVVGSLLKPSQTSNLQETSVLNKSELDANYAPKTFGTPNAVLITDANGNITASTVITVSELNTLNNNVTNLKTKIEALEARLATLEA